MLLLRQSTTSPECLSQAVTAGKLPLLGSSREDCLGAQVLPKVSKMLLPCTIKFQSASCAGQAFLDSGAAANFIDFDFVSLVAPSLIPLFPPIQVSIIDMTPLHAGLVKFRTPEIKLVVGALHVEFCSFLVMKNLSVNIILGLPWLQIHNPVIDWQSQDLVSWGPQCKTHMSQVSLCTTIASELEIPEFISDFEDVFSKPVSSPASS